MLPNSYTAHTRVYLDTESILRPLLSGMTVQRDVVPQVRLMTMAPLSRPTLESVARKTDLFTSALTDAQQDAVLVALRSHIEVVPVASAQNTFDIKFRNANILNETMISLT